MISELVKLTQRERQVLELISRENTINEIAEILYLSPHTIISHKRRILNKLNARNIAGLVRKGFEKNYLQF